MKKLLIAVITALICCILITGCVKNKNDDTPTDPPTDQTAPGDSTDPPIVGGTGDGTGDNAGDNSGDNSGNGTTEVPSPIEPQPGDDPNLPPPHIDPAPAPGDGNSGENGGTEVPDVDNGDSQKPQDESLLSFKLSGDGSYYEVDGIGSCKDANVTIPKTYSGLPVKAIAKEAFKDEKGIGNITIPSGITSIGESAFEGCTSLVSVVIPDTVQNVGKKAFYDCKHLVSISVGNSITTVGEDAFLGCNKLVEVINLSSLVMETGSTDYGYVAFYAKDIHSGKSKIEDQKGYIFYVFDGSAYLLGYTGKDTALFLPTYKSSIYHIYPYAFYERTDLVSVSLASTVLSVGEYAFCGCTSLRTVTNNSIADRFGDSAFRDCTSLTDICINYPVIDVGDNLYSGCTSLTSISLTYNLTYLSENMFRGCTALESVVLKDGLKSIYSGAFYGCESLASISIPNTVNHISSDVFEGCNSLIRTEGGVRYADKWVVGCDKAAESVTLRTDTVGIAALAFAGCGITEIYLPHGVKYVGNSAFSDCKKLVSVFAPGSISKIGSSLFSGCGSIDAVFYKGTADEWLRITKGTDGVLDKIYYTYSVTAPLEIGRFWRYEYDTSLQKDVMKKWPQIYSEGIEYVLEDSGYKVAGIGSCKDTDVVIPQRHNGKSVTAVAARAFADLKSLTGITLPASIHTVGDSAFEGCTALVSVAIHKDDYVSLGDSAFKGCPVKNAKAPAFWFESMEKAGLETAEVTYGEINYFTFEDCTKLTSVKISDKVTYVSADAFSNLPGVCDTEGGVIYVDTWVVGFDGGTEVAYVREGALGISSFAFNNSVIKGVYLPESIKYVDMYSFWGFPSLESIEVSELNPYYSSLNGNLYGKKERSLIRYAPAGTQVTFDIPDGVSYIYHYAFADCQYLEEVTFPASMTRIDSGAFEMCYSLRRISIPDGITEIEQSAFESCQNLESVTIGKYVKYIGERVFVDCYRLTSITADAENEYYKSVDGNLYSKKGDTLVQYAIGRSDTHFTVPEGVTEIYAYAFYHSQNLESVTLSDSAVTIGHYAFFGAEILSVVIKDGVTLIDDGAFEYCHKLSSAVIGKGVAIIGHSAFNGCTALESVYYTGSSEEWSDMAVQNYNTGLSDATVYFYSEAAPEESGSF